MTSNEQNDVDVLAPTAQEEPIDYDIHEPPKSRRTPLPKFQLFIVFMVQLAEPITGTVIYPFVNQFVRDTGITRGDERRTGYYAGIIESSFFFAEAFTVFHWGRLSDKLGRRPVILLGPLGLTIATLSFGLSNNFWTLVVSRSMQGAFNGNIGVTKSVMGEITDSTNVGDAFAIIPLMWSFGCTIGPIMGGLLSQPATTWPDLFGRIPFFHHYPYFLPCAVAALLASFTGLIAFLGLKETLPSALKNQKQYAAATPDSTTGLLSASEDLSYGSSTSSPSSITGVVEEEDHVPPAFKDLLVPDILMKMLVYAFVAFIDMSCQVLQPLVYSTSISNGGLGFDPYRIGAIMGTFGVVNALAQVLFLGRIIRRFGASNVQKFAQLSYLTVLSLYPLLSVFAKRAGEADEFVWAVIVIQLILSLSNSSAYATIQILILESAPNRASLGAVNGMAQAVGSAMRSVAPSIASSLFSISLQRHLAGGNMVFLILIGIALLGLRVTFLLPATITSRRG